MPWCPKCKNEYYAGVTVCADCGCDLVESLDNQVELSPLLEGSEDELSKLCDFLHQNEVLSAVVKAQQETEDYLLSCATNDFKKASKIANIFLAHQAMDELKEQSEEDEMELEDETEDGTLTSEAENETENHYVIKGTYKNYKEKAEDNKSSAYTLLLVGGIGMIAIILIALDFIKLPLNASSRYMILGVMGAMFVLFFVMGIVSFKNSKKYAKMAIAETDLTTEIVKWCKANLTVSKVDQGLFDENEADMNDEQKYFERFTRIKELISMNFLNLDESYLDRFVDEHYDNVMKENW